MRQLIATPEGVETTTLHVVVHYATRDHEARAIKDDNYRVSWQSWRSVCRQRISNLAFLTADHWKAVY